MGLLNILFKVRATSGGKRAIQMVRKFLPFIDYKKFHFRRIKEYIDPHGKKAIVIGCGDGNDCRYVVGLGAGEVVGIDLRDDVGFAYKNDKVTYFRMSAEDLDFPDNTFDITISYATLEHVADIEAAYEEMGRITRPGGIIYCVAGPLWHSLQGHHMKELLDTYPWGHLRMSKKELIGYAVETNMPNPYPRVTAEEFITNWLYKDNFNKLPPRAYLDVCNKVKDVEIIMNTISYAHRAYLTPSILAELNAKGYEENDLLATSHTFIARKL